MKKHLSILLLISCISCVAQKKSIIRDNVSIEINPYEDNGQTKASAMPFLNLNSELIKYGRRFEYLLINVSEIYLPSMAQERNELWQLYPDTVKLKRLCLDKFIEDEKLVSYFDETAKYVRDSSLIPKTTFTKDELMEVASKFFYCDKILPDSAVQAHICVAINGVEEANWSNDYTLLQAFCYEGIFTLSDTDSSQIYSTFVDEKKMSVDKFKKNITSLDQYLQDVKLDLFERIRTNEAIKKELLAYYDLNKNNLAFRVIE
jgi:hypothetical protein